MAASRSVPDRGANAALIEFAGADIVVAGRRLTPTPVFRTYWEFAEARQALYRSRISGAPPPWSPDPILRKYRFTNVFRAADRVSQFLIREVIYGERASENTYDMVFRVLLFKLFNKISTWLFLEAALGEITWKSFDFDRYSKALDWAASKGPVYSPAYVIPPPRLGEPRKRLDHLRLLERMMRDGFPHTAESGGLQAVYEALRGFPSMGRFLAFQFTIDLNYSPLMSADENEFVVAGPGARDGIRKCFGPESRGIEEEIIRFMVDRQDVYFAAFAPGFDGLFGRPLHLIDCQNLFCEVDKYARVAHPDVAGISGRTRIKQRFRPSRYGFAPYFPPKWAVKVPAELEAVAGQRQLFDTVG